MKVNKARLTKTLQELVRIPSHESCGEISRYIAGEIRKLGIRPEVDGDGNVIARIGSGQAMLLNAHVDTVGVSGYKDPYSGEVRGDRLYGRGSTDDKSGVAAMLELMKILKHAPPSKQVIFAFTVWEESGDEKTDGAYKVADSIRATHALVLESSVKEGGGMMIDTGCKGRFVYTIEVLGKAIHSARPDKGTNSIYMATKLIDKLRGMKTTSMDIPKVGKADSVFSITQIDAREGDNVIPGKCTLTADYRALPGEKEPDIRRTVEKICRKTLGNKYRIAHLDVKHGFLQRDASETESFSEAIKDSGMGGEIGFCGGWLDASVFHRKGMITFNCGPGTKGQAHRNPEYCWIPGLVKGTQAVLNAIRRWDAQ